MIDGFPCDCEHCRKLEISKDGLLVDLETAKGIYKNHGAPRYCVCDRHDRILYWELDYEAARRDADSEWLDLHIVDLESL